MSTFFAPKNKAHGRCPCTYLLHFTLFVLVGHSKAASAVNPLLFYPFLAALTKVPPPLPSFHHCTASLDSPFRDSRYASFFKLRIVLQASTHCHMRDYQISSPFSETCTSLFSCILDSTALQTPCCRRSINFGTPKYQWRLFLKYF